ncbi:hypothetical protein L596_015158 [Steinernema carpocapsae]|uniref:Uncharacterized protein n=1 Tax=Steinernema carpocapsae TaxID=34508 RepID=A0A4U5NF17_STECR|nr:hypothetical protein L596_015158 [Steinernema carpocapsae]
MRRSKIRSTGNSVMFRASGFTEITITGQYSSCNGYSCCDVSTESKYEMLATIMLATSKVKIFYAVLIRCIGFAYAPVW